MRLVNHRGVAPHEKSWRDSIGRPPTTDNIRYPSKYYLVLSIMLLRRSIVISRRHRSRCLCTSFSPRSRFFSADKSTTPSFSDNGSSKQGLSRLFTDEQRELLKQAHQLSSMSRSLAKQVGNVKIREESLLVDIAKCLQQGRKQKQQPLETSEVPVAADVIPSLFTVVFAGEFNSGKSTLINALCGKELLESGVLPTTDKITVLMASEDDDSNPNNESKTIQVDTGVVAQTELRLLPTSTYPILSDLCIIDTPGTNAILSLQHTSSTLRLLHDADLIVFVTSADRPFSESERQLLQTSIKPYRKRVVLVINKIDILERRQGDDHGQQTKRKVEEYVSEHASDLLGARPMVIPVSGRDALSWKQLHRQGFVGSENESSSNKNLWQRSNFGKLETFLSATLTASSKIKTKLSNPLGVAEGILLDCKHEIERRQEDLDVDVATLKLLRSDSEAWEKDMQSILERHRANINKEWTMRANVVHRVLDELTLIDQLRIGVGMGRPTFDRAWENANITSVSSTGKETSSFTNKLISITSECSETLVTGAKRQGEDQIEYLGKRVSVISTGLKGNNSKMIGKIDTPKFQRLGDELQASIINVVEKTTKHIPTDLKCADDVYTSLCRTSMLSSLLMSSALGGFLDMSQGMLLGSATLAVTGAASLPLGSSYVARSFEKEWMSNASKLESGLNTLFSDALQRINAHLSGAIAPYTRYVKAEEASLISLHRKMESGIADATRLRGQINKACE
jgi:small GTP-binding protein